MFASGKCGPVAQLGARMNGIHEVTGSTPVWSTILRWSIPVTWVTDYSEHIGNISTRAVDTAGLDDGSSGFTVEPPRSSLARRARRVPGVHVGARHATRVAVSDPFAEAIRIQRLPWSSRSQPSTDVMPGTTCPLPDLPPAPKRGIGRRAICPRVSPTHPSAVWADSCRAHRPSS